jgi:hypothetical protein
VNFQPELAELVAEGRKTVTRRLVSDNPRSPWFRGGCSLKEGRSYAVCPGRGEPAICRVRVVSVRREQAGGVARDLEEPRREGFRDLDDFMRTWERMHGEFDPGALVWRVEFALER